MLVLNQISKKFHDLLVANNISLSIEKGEFVSFLGPSGCGKTSLFKIICGFLEQDSGEVIIEGKLCSRGGDCFIAPHKRSLGMVFQNLALMPHMTVRGNLEFALKNAKDKTSKINLALEALDLSELANLLPNQLSGGQMQRVALARSIIVAPKLLLLDEPFTGLDAISLGRLKQYLSFIQEKYDLTIILITHNIKEAIALSDRIAVFQKGNLLAYANATELYGAPNCKYIAHYMGEANFIIYKDKEYLVRPENCSLELSLGVNQPTQNPEGIVSLPVRIKNFLYLGANVEVEVVLDDSPDEKIIKLYVTAEILDKLTLGQAAKLNFQLDKAKII